MQDEEATNYKDFKIIFVTLGCFPSKKSIKINAIICMKGVKDLRKRVALYIQITIHRKVEMLCFLFISYRKGN